MAWWDFFKLFSYSFAKGPMDQGGDQLSGAGVTTPDVIPNIRSDGSFWSGSKGLIRLRDSNDFIDLSSVTNRQSRYKEYERLRNVAEIEMAMTVFADEACLVGKTKVATPFGSPTIKWLAENKADERFLVYCWDFKKEDYTLGWAHTPRLVKQAETVRIFLDDGTKIIATPDHRVLKRDGTWIEAGELQFGDELMPFYKEKPDNRYNKLKVGQFPRIFTFKDGWKHERQFVDEWKTGKKNERLEKVNHTMRLLSQGMDLQNVSNAVGHEWKTLSGWINQAGFTVKEGRMLGKKEDRRRVVDIHQWKKMNVYDLSVDNHENFCGESTIFHNCQVGENHHIVTVECSNTKVKEEVEFLFYKLLKIDRRIWNWAKNLFIFGDYFVEVIINPNNPKDGILKTLPLPCESMYKIETTKGKLIEFQQSKEGPDYQSLTRVPVTKANEADLQQSTAIRFHPNQIVHMKIGDDRRTFYPYGVSLIEPARGPAHQLRLMEDAMLVYRLTRAPERRVFYIDVGQLPPFKAEAFMERMKDQFRKKKVSSGKGGNNASSVEERWHAPAQDEDYWLPLRPNSGTRIETLPGAQNLGEIDDAIYFRNKLFAALNFPKSYFSQEDPNATRITLSAQDVKFARMIERLQTSLEDGLYSLAERHLELRGFPEESYEDLMIKLTPPSDWRELSRVEIITNRINNAGSLKGSALLSDFDILTKWLKYTEEEAGEMLSRLKLQKLEDLKLQVIGQNPQLMGVGMPGQQPDETEIGLAAGGPAPELDAEAAPEAAPEGTPPEAAPEGTPPEAEAAPAGTPLAEPDNEDVKKYDLEIRNPGKDQDEEEIDYSEVE